MTRSRSSGRYSKSAVFHPSGSASMISRTSPWGEMRNSWPSHRETRRFPSPSVRIPSIIPDPKEMMFSIRPVESSTFLSRPSPELPLKQAVRPRAVVSGGPRATVTIGGVMVCPPYGLFAAPRKFTNSWKKRFPNSSKPMTSYFTVLVSMPMEDYSKRY